MVIKFLRTRYLTAQPHYSKGHLSTTRHAPRRSVNESDAAQIVLFDHLAYDESSCDLEYIETGLHSHGKATV